ncbi:DUF3152 domain-containing protein, partial [Amycolatopsis coloradensis]|uniref:DUF3152 domain-containing protein n=1 Tax=Amycolatopsis coloradensis TaxID=76021 RepID=UPI003F4CC8A5
HSFEGDLLAYHRYAVNHEVGHALGHGHVGCPESGFRDSLPTGHAYETAER